MSEQQPQWATASMQCSNCGLEWVGVFPVPDDNTQFHGLECPRCHQFSNEFVIPVPPPQVIKPQLS
jgi:hypothetical protein